MTGKERLFNTAAGKIIDRPAVNFYEINGITQRINLADEFNIYNDSSWQPLLQLAREKTDMLVTYGVAVEKCGQGVEIVPGFLQKTETRIDGGQKIHKTEICANGRILTSRHMRERDIDTSWCIEHLIKDVDDLRAWVELPENELSGEVDIATTMEVEAAIGDNGALLLDTLDPLCAVAALMDMANYTIIAMTEQELFRKALDKAARFIYWKVEQIAAAFPGRFWRIYGPEYASPPYLPPYLFREYVTGYDKKLVEIIHRSGGFARIHSHGRLKDILDYIVETGCDGLDPIEPPHQGDVTLAYVREKYGRNLVLFGNLEASDLENLPDAAFREKVKTAIAEGAAGEGRGFVLQPSACPYGRKLSPRAMRNYEVIIEEIEQL